jgi:hypothetical protein
VALEEVCLSKLEDAIKYRVSDLSGTNKVCYDHQYVVFRMIFKYCDFLRSTICLTQISSSLKKRGNQEAQEKYSGTSVVWRVSTPTMREIDAVYSMISQ